MKRLIALFDDLCGRGFTPIATKEILCAAAGLKLTRLSVSDEDLASLEEFLPSYGLQLLASKEKFGIAKDVGKGGWSNRFTNPLPQDAVEGYRKLYIAPGSVDMHLARTHDAAGDDNSLGEELGIPPCCRSFYDTFVKQAFGKQGDLVPITLRNTKGDYPFDFWNNSATQYFGYSLLSFSPCSFNCTNAAEIAKKTYEFLASINTDFANAFLEHHRHSVLYTEYEGVFLFVDAEYKDGELSYRAAKSTNPESDIARAIARGNCVLPRGVDGLRIQAGKKVLKDCEGSDLALCIFSENGPFTREERGRYVV